MRLFSCLLFPHLKDYPTCQGRKDQGGGPNHRTSDMKGQRKGHPGGEVLVFSVLPIAWHLELPPWWHSITGLLPCSAHACLTANHICVTAHRYWYSDFSLSSLSHFLSCPQHLSYSMATIYLPTPKTVVALLAFGWILIHLSQDECSKYILYHGTDPPK